MNKIKCIIVDDEPLAVGMLENFVSRTPSLELVSSFTDPVEALARISEVRPDLVFLDIQMPDLNGLELSKMLPDCTYIIFTTAFKQYAYESYEVEAVDYLLKPICYQKFLEAVAKVQRRLAGGQQVAEQSAGQYNVQSAEQPSGQTSVFIRTDRAFRRVELNDIQYISGLKDYVTIYLEGEKEPIVAHLTMKSIEEMLPSERFMRVHRSHIVALSKITSIDSNGDVLLGSAYIPVSDSYRPALEAFIAQNLLK